MSVSSPFAFLHFFSQTFGGSSMCPFCSSEIKAVKKGFYTRKSDGKRIQKYQCKQCFRVYSEQHFGIDYRLRLRDMNQPLFFSLCSGMSQRRCAHQYKTKPATIARRVERFGKICQMNLESYRRTRPKATVVQIDEMESFEHSKCKPVTMPIVVEEKTRKILCLRVGQIAAKGHLAAISRKKYGPRSCERKRCLKEVLGELKGCVSEALVIKSDESPHYPDLIKEYFPGALHRAYKGRRGCVVGQGELKKGGFDPIFTLNHSYAMIRDNVKRLSRRTWCTTKLQTKLELFLFIYAWFHNLWLDRNVQPIKLVRVDG